MKLKTAFAFGLSVIAAASVQAADLVIATVNNGHMIEMQKHTKDFEKANPGITLKWVTLEEGTLRQRVTTDIATKGGQFDVMTIGLYEAPIWSKKGWLTRDQDRRRVRRRRHPAGDPQRPVARRQALRRAVLRRKLDDDVPRRPGQGQGPDDAVEPDLGPDGRHRLEDPRPGQGRVRPVPARQTGLGRQHGLPDHDGQRLRRPVVRHGLEAADRLQALARRDHAVRRPDEEVRPTRCFGQQLQREPRALQRRQVRRVDRRDDRRLVHQRSEAVEGRRQGGVRGRRRPR